MITVKYSGRFANCVFQYWAAALFALKNDLNRDAVWPMGDWVGLNGAWFAPQQIQDYGASETITDDNFEEWLARPKEEVPQKMNYHFTGYFQRMDLLNEHVDLLRNLFSWRKVEPLDDDSICMHVRLADHGAGRLYLDPQWYVSILEQETFKNLVICTDDPNATGHFDAYRKWHPRIHFSPNAMKDFDLIRSHRKIIIGPSSYAVLAALTGHATLIYQWKRDQELSHIKYQIESVPGRMVVPVDGKFYSEVNS